jgi:membrane-associated phospholipid phosphatase
MPRTLNNIFRSLFLILVFQGFALAQDKIPDVTGKETPKEIQIEKKQSQKLYSLAQFEHESVLFIKQPTKWKSKSWWTLGAVVATTIAVMPFDDEIADASQGNQQFTVLANAGTTYGEWYSIIGVAGVFGVYGLIAKDTTAKKVSIELLQAGLYSELITTMLKVAIGRARPEISDDQFTFKPFSIFEYDYHSMPSGHTTSAFALSTVMSRHAKSTVLKILAYFPAGLTMFARIYQNQHWLSDEILGAAIGYFVGNWVVDMHEGKRHRINVTSFAPLGVSYGIGRKW